MNVIKRKYLINNIAFILKIPITRVSTIARAAVQHQHANLLKKYQKVIFAIFLKKPVLFEFNSVVSYDLPQILTSVTLCYYSLDEYS